MNVPCQSIRNLQPDQDTGALFRPVNLTRSNPIQCDMTGAGGASLLASQTTIYYRDPMTLKHKLERKILKKRHQKRSV